MFVNYCNKGSQATQVGSHGIKASYITVHSILVINTHPLPQTHVITNPSEAIYQRNKVCCIAVIAV